MSPRRTPQPEEWTTEQVAAFLGYTGDSAEATARGWLARKGIQPVAREPGRAGKNLWPTDQVRAKREAWDGRGRRADLEPKETK